MKGRIIDIYNSEAFISLDDDTVLTVPINSLTNNFSVGSTISLSQLTSPTGFNNHIKAITNEKLMDFF